METLLEEAALPSGVNAVGYVEVVDLINLQWVSKRCYVAVKHIAVKWLKEVYGVTEVELEHALQFLHFKASIMNTRDPHGYRYVSCGSFHTVFNTRKRIYGFGKTTMGRMGQVDSTAFDWARKRHPYIAFLGISPMNVKQLSAGKYHTSVLTKQGDLYVFGELGRCSFGMFKDPKDPSKTTQNTKNVYNVSPHNKVVQASGRFYSLGWVTEEGYVFVLGRTWPEAEPQRVSGFGPGDSFGRAAQVTCGDRHIMIISEHGLVYTWGYGVYGRLGHGNELSVPNPKLVDWFVEEGISAESCSAGLSHSAIITTDGHLYTWGSGKLGKLGTKNQLQRLVPTLIPQVAEYGRPVQVECGNHFTAVLFDSGKVVVLGVTDNQEEFEHEYEVDFIVHDNDDEEARVFPMIRTLAEENVTQIAAGPTHLACQTYDAKILTFGNNEAGQLGYDTGASTSQVTLPMAVSLLKRWQFSFQRTSQSLSYKCSATMSASFFQLLKLYIHFARILAKVLDYRPSFSLLSKSNTN